MKRDFFRKSFSILFLSFAALHGVAQNASPTKELVALPTLVAEALRTHPALRVAEAGVAAAKGEATSAKAFANPELTVAPGAKHVSENGDVLFSGELELTQLLEFPGKRELRKAIAERNIAAGKLALAGLRYQIELEVRKAFYELLAAQQIERIRAEQVQSGRVFAESVRKRIEAGYASDFESLKAESDLVNAQKLLREAQGQISAAAVSLNTLAGRPANAPLKLAGTLDERAQPVPADVLNFALQNNPAIQVQRVEMEKAGLNVKATKLSRNPDFTVGPVFELGEDEQVYGFGVSVPLPFWNRKTGEIQSAKAEEQKAIAEIDRLQFEIVRAVKIAEQNLRAANDELAFYTPQFLNQLKAFAGQAEKTYAQNATTLLVYLDARRTYFDTLADFHEARGKAAAARAELESAVGAPVDSKPTQP